MTHKIFVFFVALCFIFSASALRAGTSLKSKSRMLSRTECAQIARHLAKELISDPFFQSAELPPRMVLVAIQLKGVDLGTTQKEFTDLVLNKLIDEPKVIIANQDFSTDIAANYKLMFYLSEQETRQKGVLLGADYTISGSLESQSTFSDAGKERRVYVSHLVVKDIRTNKLVVSANYDSSDRKK